MSTDTHPAQPGFAQNPEELFDVVNEDGSPTGQVKRRADVHRDGDWHRAIHVWIYGIDEAGPFILFNLRGYEKDTWPGRLDVTVGGHLGAGEHVEDAFREVAEEIGVELVPAGVEFLCRRRAPGETERELQDVFLIRDDRDLSAYRPNPAELVGLVRMSVETALEIFSGASDAGPATMLDSGSHRIEPLLVDWTNVLPRSYHAYYLSIAETVARRMGQPPTPPV